MEEAIRVFVDQCPCKTAKETLRKAEGFKDIAGESLYVITEQNQVIFLDLYGPLNDGNYLLVMVDGFDGYLVVKPLFPNYDLTVFGIIKCIIFNWI